MPSIVLFYFPTPIKHDPPSPFNIAQTVSPNCLGLFFKVSSLVLSKQAIFGDIVTAVPTYGIRSKWS